MLLKKTKDPVSRAASRHNGRRGREKAELARRTRRQERQENLQVQYRPSPKTAGTPLSTDNSSSANEGEVAIVEAEVPPAVRTVTIAAADSTQTSRHTIKQMMIGARQDPPSPSLLAARANIRAEGVSDPSAQRGQHLEL